MKNLRLLPVIWGGFSFLLLAPFLVMLLFSLFYLLLGDDPVGEFAVIVMDGAGEFPSEYGTKQLLVGIFLLLIFGGSALYLLGCLLGVILLLLLRELHAARK